MRAVAFREYGGPEVLEVLELPDPEPGPGQVRIRVAAATVNPSDTLFRSGGLARGIDGPPPWVAGLELAGFVDAVGDGTGYTPGERVAAMTRFLPHGRGAQSELLVLDAESSLARVPDGLDLVEAATVPMTGLTVRLLLDTLALPPGATVVVTGAAGAVGGFAVELAAAEGLRVIAIASPGDEQFVREVGAAEFVPGGDGAFAAVHAHVPGGADALIDAAVIGAPVLDAVRDGGRVAAVRPFKGESERGIAIDLVSVRTYLDRADRLEALLDRAARGGLRLRVAETFPPERAAEAHALLEAGGLRGRPVIVF
jgi:NADPH:quinone reductase-like Zn-dependent oxidoreductase